MTYPVAPLKRVLSRNDGGVWGDEPTGSGDSVVLRSTDQSADGEWLDVEPALRSLSPLDRHRSRLLAGDLLLTKSSGSALHIGKTTIVTNAIAESCPGYSNFMQRLRVTPENVPRYFWYCFRSEFVRDQLSLISTTTTGLANLNASTINQLEVPCPRPDEQRQIADYLDAQTAKIDALIGKQERLIETLAERRQAVISHAVTKGLDPNVPMKDSRVEWAGAIPAHWEFGNLRRFAAMRTGHTPSRSRGEYWVDCTIPWFTLSDVWQLRQGNRFLGETSSLISEIGLANSAAELLPAGTVVLSRTASVGFTGIMPQPMATSQDFWNWVCGRALEPNYLWYQFNAMRPHFASLVQGSTHKTIYQGDAASLKIAAPPSAEQYEIVEHLDRETSQIDALSAKAREMIDVLKERRQALISAAVTGKIDVRTTEAQ